MAKIKEVRASAIIMRCGSRCFRAGYYWTDRQFTTFIDDNGNKRYFIGEAFMGEEVTKDEGNKRYIEMKKLNADYQQTNDCKKFVANSWKRYKASKTKEVGAFMALSAKDTFQETVKEYEISYEELIKRFDDSIDKYTEYIEDPKQSREADARNSRIWKCIREIKKLVEERQ